MSEVPAPARRSLVARLLRWPLEILGRLLRAVPMAIEGYFAHRLPQHAAGIAYRVLFSLAPLAIVLVSIFGLVLRNDDLRQDVIDWIVDWLPVSDSGRQSVEDAVTNLASPASALGLVSLVLFAWAATGMMAAIRNGLETALQTTQARPAARAKALDFVLVAATGALVLVAIALTFLAQVVSRLAREASAAIGLGNGLIEEVTRSVVPIVLSTAVVILLYRFVPSRKLRFGDVLAGALVTSLLFALISVASAFVFDKATNLSVIYGSITTALVFLYSVYLYASALLFGAEVASAWSAPDDGTGQPLLVQLKQAALGLFVHRDPPDRPA